MEAIPEVQGTVRPPKDLTVTPPQAMCDPNGPRDKSGSCQKGRGKERVASSLVSVSHNNLAAVFAVSGTLENGQEVAFIPGSFLSRQETRHRIKEEVGEETHIQPGAESLGQDEAGRWRSAAFLLCQAQRDRQLRGLCWGINACCTGLRVSVRLSEPHA